jgi:hypothetical protein
MLDLQCWPADPDTNSTHHNPSQAGDLPPLVGGVSVRLVAVRDDSTVPWEQSISIRCYRLPFISFLRPWLDRTGRGWPARGPGVTFQTAACQTRRGRRGVVGASHATKETWVLYVRSLKPCRFFFLLVRNVYGSQAGSRSLSSAMAELVGTSSLLCHFVQVPVAYGSAKFRIKPSEQCTLISENFSSAPPHGAQYGF